jgi:uncharacterized FAD-dependent dehydrogenase
MSATPTAASWSASPRPTTPAIRWPASNSSASGSRAPIELGGGNYDAPGQLVGDFLKAKPSTQLGSVTPSYKPGVLLGELDQSLPDYAIDAMREALPFFDKQIRGYAMHDAVLTGVETRTSSPMRIRRHDDTLQSLNTKGLYPAGEGAGYAGGIMSAAIDGIAWPKRWRWPSWVV